MTSANSDWMRFSSLAGESSSRPLASRLSVWLYIATLAWAPFPLGSNREWSWSFLVLLIALCWIVWGIGTWFEPRDNWGAVRRIAFPALLGMTTLCWGLIQLFPFVPDSWAHPIWNLAAETLHDPLRATISIDPWSTATECMKLASYAAAAVLSFLMSRRVENASRLLTAVIVIGAGYGLYAFGLKFLGFTQYQLFYSGPQVDGRWLSGPFVLHNSYATYTGMVSIAALAHLVFLANAHIVTHRGLRPWLLSALQFLFGRGFPALIGFLLCFSALVASASRAGFVATLCGLAASGFVLAFVSGSRIATRWSLFGGILLCVLIVVLTAMSGEGLADRLNQLVDMDYTDTIRTSLRAAASRMISDAPLLGLGLGTFEDAYPLYAHKVLPYVMDRAHCDYLEFAAGLGLPAAVAWWSGWALLVLRCLRGVFMRRRNRHYALIACGVSVLVGVHSAFDFSLQMPAVALTCATLLGLGLGQSFPLRAA